MSSSPTRRHFLGRSLRLAAGALALRPGLGAPSPRSELRVRKVRDLTGPDETGAFGAPWTDLAIPARCPDGSLFFACGDTFAGEGVGGPDWRSPIGLRSRRAKLSQVRIDGAVGGEHATALVQETHEGRRTTLPSDVFTVGDTMYLHTMRGVLHRPEHTDLWRSRDNGESWEHACRWPAALHGGAFQQKSFALAPDGLCYVVSTRFDRARRSELLLHRVPVDRLGEPGAYEPWGFANGEWKWGQPPTTIDTPRRWGELSFRRIDDHYVLSWLNMEPLGLYVTVLPTILSNWFERPEVQLIRPCAPDEQGEDRVASPYGGFLFPGSTLDDLHLAVSQWHDARNYRVMQYRVRGLRP